MRTADFTDANESGNFLAMSPNQRSRFVAHHAVLSGAVLGLFAGAATQGITPFLEELFIAPIGIGAVGVLRMATMSQEQRSQVMSAVERNEMSELLLEQVTMAFYLGSVATMRVLSPESAAAVSYAGAFGGIAGAFVHCYSDEIRNFGDDVQQNGAEAAIRNLSENLSNGLSTYFEGVTSQVVDYFRSPQTPSASAENPEEATPLNNNLERGRNLSE